jgi:alpha-methylacyl-CoA racemase
MLPHAHVLLDPFRPGVLRRMGLSPQLLASCSPSLVVARITGYGQTGPWARRAGHDINYVAMSGLLDTFRRKLQSPQPPGNVLADFAGGGLMAVAGVSMALLHVARTGCGCDVDVGMAMSTAYLACLQWEFQAAGIWSAPPGCNLLDGGAPFYTCYAAAGGGHLAVGALEPAFFAALCSALGLSKEDKHRFGAQQMDPAVWPDMRSVFSAAVAQHSMQHWRKVIASHSNGNACLVEVLQREHWHEHEIWQGRTRQGRAAGGLSLPSAEPEAEGRKAGSPGSRRGTVHLPQACPVITPLGMDTVSDATYEGGAQGGLPAFPRQGADTSRVLQELAGLSSREVHQLLATGVALQASNN